MTRIGATSVDVQELRDLNTLAVVFAERADGSGERLEIQRALSFDEQDREEGMDIYCVCVSSGATHYGGVASWSLDKGGLELTLSSEAAEELGLEEEVRVDIELSAALLEKVMAGLRQALAEVPPRRC